MGCVPIQMLDEMIHEVENSVQLSVAPSWKENSTGEKMIQISEFIKE